MSFMKCVTANIVEVNVLDVKRCRQCLIQNPAREKCDLDEVGFEQTGG